MSNTIKKEEVVNNSNQPQKKEMNIDYLINEIKTFSIYTEDFEEIWDLGYLEECLEKFESDEYHIQECLNSVKERIETIEHIKELEDSIKYNYQMILDKEEFIEKVCVTDEDSEDVENEIETLREDIEDMESELDELYNP